MRKEVKSLAKSLAKSLESYDFARGFASGAVAPALDVHLALGAPEPKRAAPQLGLEHRHLLQGGARR